MNCKIRCEGEWCVVYASVMCTTEDLGCLAGPTASRREGSSPLLPFSPPSPQRTLLSLAVEILGGIWASWPLSRSAILTHLWTMQTAVGRHIACLLLSTWRCLLFDSLPLSTQFWWKFYLLNQVVSPWSLVNLLACTFLWTSFVP